MARVAVCRVGDLAEGLPVVVETGGRRIVVARWGERVFAVRDICPHMSASFARGRVQARVIADAGAELSLACDEPTLVCPWHAWEFSLETGCSLADPGLRVRTYPVSVDERGMVVVTLPVPPARPPASATAVR
jgi:nitrite reductase (NADH) small subunit